MKKSDLLFGTFAGIFATVSMDILFNLFLKMISALQVVPPMAEVPEGMHDHTVINSVAIATNYLQLLLHYAAGVSIAYLSLICSRLLYGRLVSGIWPFAFGGLTSLLLLLTQVSFVQTYPGPLTNATPIYFQFTICLLFGFGLWGGFQLTQKLSAFSQVSGIQKHLAEKDSEYVSGLFLLSLSAFQAIAAACMGIVFMIGSIALVDMSGGNKIWAGVPVALILGTSALLAYPLAMWKDRKGYRSILLFASLVGILGICLAIVSVIMSIREILLLGFICVGAATCSILLSRFAAAETAVLQQRGKALSVVMTGATIGAIGGPLLANMANGLGFSTEAKLVAPFLVALLLYILGLMIIRFGLPKPAKNVTRQINNASVTPSSSNPIDINIVAAIVSIIGAQAAMVFLMAVTPVHMHSHAYPVEDISRVLSIHFLGMYGTSFLSGRLTDRIGRMSVIAIGALLLIFAYLCTLLFQGEFIVYLSLFLLGVGWNFCFISSSVMLIDYARSLKNGKIQGINDVLVNLSAGTASLSSGFVLKSYGVTGLGLVGIIFAVTTLIALLILQSHKLLKR